MAFKKKPPEDKISINHLFSSDGKSYDSELTFRGTKRKRKYPVGRKAYHNPATGERILKKDYLAFKDEAKLILTSYAPKYSVIYTDCYRWREDRYFIDIMCCVNNRIYRISRLVAMIIQRELASSKSRNSVKQISYPVQKGLYTYAEINTPEVRMKFEEQLVKDLSMEMFNIDNGYIWQSLSTTYQFDIEYRGSKEKTVIQRVETKTEDISEETENKPKKTFRLR